MPDWAQWVSFVLGTVGAILGVTSTWIGMRRGRPHLRVRPVWLAERTIDNRNVVTITRRADRVDDLANGTLGMPALPAMVRLLNHWS